MPDITIFELMTDEQLALWHQQDTRIQQLTRELAEARTAAEAAQAAAEVEASNLKAALDRSCTTVLELTARNAEERGATRRLCGQQVQLLRALAALTRACDGVKVDEQTSPDPEAWWKALKEAHEVLALNSIPF